LPLNDLLLQHPKVNLWGSRPKHKLL